MFVQRIFAAIAALLVSAMLMETANAFPYAARTGTTTVTGTFRPLELNLNLVESATPPGTISPLYSDLYYGGGEGEPYLSLYALFTGTYKTTGASSPGGVAITGDAGYWAYSLSIVDSIAAAAETGLSIINGGSSFEVMASGAGKLFGTLEYLGGGAFTIADGASGNVPYVDTPQTNDCSVRCNDYFKYYTTEEAPALSITLTDFVEDEGGGSYSNFELSFTQDIQHLGPFGSPLDLSRTNTACFTGGVATFDANNNVNNAIPCGSVTFSASSTSTAVPEPASLALVGLGLAGLALARRRQQRLLQA